MKLYNIKDHNEQVSFAQAIKQGLGRQQGLFFPLELPKFAPSEIDQLLKLDLVTREEFDVQAQVLAKTRAKLEALETRLAELEAKLGQQ